MKHRLVIFGLFVSLSLGMIQACARTPAEPSADIRTIKQLVEQHAASAREGDYEGMAATMHKDAVARLDDGSFLSGRQANARFYEQVVAGGPHRLAHRHPAESIRIRFLTPHVAFVDVDSVAATTTDARTPYFLVFTKVDGEWGVAEVRNGPSYEPSD